MAQIIVRNLDDGVRDQLRRRAARKGRSMEEEVREILAAAMAQGDASTGGLGSRIAARFADLGLTEAEAECVEALRREPLRAPPFA